MACARSLERCTLNFTRPISKSTPKHNPNQLNFSNPTSRRCVILISTLPLSFTLLPQSSEARERRNRKNIPLEDYLTGPDGLKYYDFVEGKGALAEKGSTVQVHFDCMFRGITAISTRESKLLAGNRSIAQVQLSILQQEDILTYHEPGPDPRPPKNVSS